ncbi:choline transporter-like 2 [Culicoides brevitarsis]|uniref:choline transporter-like 2 n=1 Tax=Culicoides brevitarsis TaxID=469753 RepID=UPI00307CC794
MDSRPVGIFDEAKRHRTNAFWNFAFLLAILTFIGFGIFASFSNGPAGILMDGNQTFVAYKGSHCGFDSDVLDKKLQIDIDERKCNRHNPIAKILHCQRPWICVKTCPTGSFDVRNCTKENFKEVKERLVCQDEKVKDNVKNCEEAQEAVDDKKCVGFYNNTEDFFGSCASDKSLHGYENEPNFGQMILYLLPSFIYAIGVAGVISLFFALTLRWSAAFVFWGFVVLIILGCIGSLVGIVVLQLYDAENQKNLYGLETEETKSAIYFEVGVVSVLLLIVMIFLCCFRQKIRCGIEIVKESSRCVCASVGSIFFPIFPFLLRAGVLIATGYIVLMMHTMRSNQYKIHGEIDENCFCIRKNYTNGDSCTPEVFNSECRTVDNNFCTSVVCKLSEQTVPKFAKPLITVTLMISTWIVAFIQANAKMILAYVYGNWYWNWNRQYIPRGAVVTGMKKILGNHTGTAAFGGFIVMICRVFKKMLYRQNNSNGPFKAVIGRIIFMILACCARSIIELVEFVSDKAFVVVAITGNGFWESVKGVSKLMTKDIPLVVATEYVGDIILFVCKFMAAVVAAALFVFTCPLREERMFLTIFAAVLIFFFAFDLAAVLLTAYNVAIDTLLICTIQDYTHCGTEKAYFESETLNQLLLKKEVASV